MEEARPKLTFNEKGEILLQNRAMRRKRKNRADLEGKSKKYYTKKRKK